MKSEVAVKWLIRFSTSLRPCGPAKSAPGFRFRAFSAFFGLFFGGVFLVTLRLADSWGCASEPGRGAEALCKTSFHGKDVKTGCRQHCGWGAPTSPAFGAVTPSVMGEMGGTRVSGWFSTAARARFLPAVTAGHAMLFFWGGGGWRDLKQSPSSMGHPKALEQGPWCGLARGGGAVSLSLSLRSCATRWP